MRMRWSGIVLDWDGKSSFGRPVQLPRKVTLSVYASSEEEAHCLLHILAERQGYALGGVQEIHPSAETPQPKSHAWRTMGTSRKAEPELSLEQKLERIKQLQQELDSV